MKRVFLVLIVVFGIFAYAVAQAGVLVNMEVISVLTSGVKTFTAASIKDDTKQGHYAKRAFCTVYGGQLNFTYDGVTTPTTGATGVGHYLQNGDSIAFDRYSDIRDFQAIAATATVTLTCSYEF